MLGWDRRAAAAASRTSLSSRIAPLPAPETTLNATVRPSERSRAS